ncbi:hypothetical protein A3D06_00030 [Candidatus Roizmanbacteria bacterium RIFCSPHIGHO2_02_FULL_40_9]|uniref:Uncharacterized protein n=1 Tax=Candidatus Roizmanbacteria bacterium RIFCSPHIGHO2_02_FULL_40_9 TaxID=1802042 RepID=A0A1F7HDV5_9BACT|nr:MAG: hypothetical protein A3D06_00030 [Candidatus Roizmanbacteria bacterium RIFCSPHIGHO2_02_FULL_40_9]
MLSLFSFTANAQIQKISESGCVTSDGVPTLKCLEVVFSNVLVLASAIVVLILFIMFVVGSFLYLTSRGDPEGIKKAQGTIKFALIGLLLFMGSYLILNIINVVFGLKGDLMKFEIPENLP